MPVVWSEPFRHEQAGRSLYPFGDRATLQATSGAVFDRDAFLDLTLHPAGAAPGLGLVEIEVESGLVTLHVGLGPRQLLASAVFDPTVAPSLLKFVDTLGRPAGLAVCDSAALATIGGWPRGRHTFPIGSAEFAARCVLIWPDPGVAALTADGAWLDGEAWIVGGLGVVVSSEGPGRIRVDSEGDALARQRGCSGASNPTPPPVLRTLVVLDDQGRRTRLLPDRYGSIALVPSRWTRTDQALRVRADGSTLTIEAAATT